MRAILCATLALAAFFAACDPVHSDAQDALGGEAPGVRRGPLHRPGQPCITCHDGAIGDPNAFSVAGTVYTDATGKTAAQGVVVELTGSDKKSYRTTTNAAGNFYVEPNQFEPVYPMTVVLDPDSQYPTLMTSAIGRDGSCADCHNTRGPGPTSAGPIFITKNGVTP